MPRSGGFPNKPGDFVANGFRVEDKFTDAKSFTLTTQMLDKIVAEALQTPPGLLPAVRITLPGHTVRVLREEDFLFLVAKASGSHTN